MRTAVLRDSDLGSSGWKISAPGLIAFMRGMQVAPRQHENVERVSLARGNIPRTISSPACPDRFPIGHRPLQAPGQVPTVVRKLVSRTEGVGPKWDCQEQDALRACQAGFRELVSGSCA